MDVLNLSLVSTAVAMTFMMDEEDILVIQGMKRKHRYWMSPYLVDRINPYQRNTLAKLERDFLRLGSVDDFRQTLRMPPDVYQLLLKKVYPIILRQNTNFRVCISVEERLSLTLRYLGLGDSIRTLHQSYLVGYSSVLPLIRDTCSAIYSVLQEEYLHTPCTTQEWLNISDGFLSRWNLPHVLGSVDGKHIRIRCPRNSGSLFYNYKNFFSMILMAVVDHDYRFIYVDVGAEGRASDSRIWRDSDFFRDVEGAENVLNIPQDRPVRGYPNTLHYFFVGDDAFALGLHLMKPFPSSNLSYEQQVFNYRLSRCRRIVENAFGILSSRFRILLRQQDMEPEGVQKVILACVAMHNFLREHCGGNYMPKGSIDCEDDEHNVMPGSWREQEGLVPVLGHQHVGNRSLIVKNMRVSLAKWCLSKHGSVPWQYKIIRNDENE